MNNRFITFAFVSLVAAAIQAQSCKTTVDPFTSQPISVFDWSRGDARLLYLEQKDSVGTIEFRHVEAQSIDYIVARGSEILMKLANGDTLKLRTFENIRSAPQVASNNPVTIVTGINLRSRITKAQLQKLASSKLVYLRHPDLHGGTRDLGKKDLSDKFCNNLLKGAKCLLGIN